MSRIFDALQRSESERSGTNSESLPAGPELLRQAERRITTNWTTDVAPQDDEMLVSEGDDVFGADGIVNLAALGQELESEENRVSGSGTDILSRFHSLSISLPPQGRLVCITDRENPTAEAVRLLSVRLRDLRRVRPLKKLLITSTIPQEGKSTIAANLACALAYASEERVLLIEGDLRRPSLSQIFGVQNVRGITEWLQSDEPELSNVYRLDAAGIWILPAGTPSRNPLEILQSQRLPAQMKELAACFDWIIIDSPPVLPLADTSIWMRISDGILLVTRQGITERRQLLKGFEALDSQKLLGALLNGSRASSYSGYYYHSTMPS